MKRRKLGLVATLLIGSILVALPAGTASSAPPNGKAESGNGDAVHWSPCFKDIAAEFAQVFPPEFGPPTYECANVPVPLDYDKPNGAKISISMVRLPALDPDSRIGSVFLNPGGPGGSGVEFAVFGAPFLYSPDLRSQFDMVGFDPRGILRSTALKCFGNLNQAFGVFDSGVFGFPRTPAEVEAWIGDEQDVSDACDQRGNKVLGRMSTANVARDMDLLRAAVGDDQLTYAGYSYGSYLGVTYANLFPDNVRALIVDGVLDPVAWSTGAPGDMDRPFSSRLASDVGAQATLEEFFRLCDEAGPRACAFAPNSSDRYEALAAELLANEPILVSFPVGPGESEEFPVFYGDFIGVTLSVMYNSLDWPFFAYELALIEAAAQGVEPPPPPFFGSAAEQLLEGYTSKRGFPRYPNFVEGFPAVACADSDNPDDVSGWVDAAGEVSSENYFTQIWTWASSVCLSFPAGDDDRYMGPFTAETANPVLVASTLYDPATPVEGAFAVDELLPNSGLLLVEGWGHTTLGLSGCASFFSENYLINQVLPPEGPLCRQDISPFALFGGPGEPGEFELAVYKARQRFSGN
jgi:pimeloyl-ACP methyl ester carboxylesterase